MINQVVIVVGLGSVRQVFHVLPQATVSGICIFHSTLSLQHLGTAISSSNSDSAKTFRYMKTSMLTAVAVLA